MRVRDADTMFHPAQATLLLVELIAIHWERLGTLVAPGKKLLSFSSLILALLKSAEETFGCY